MRLAVLWALALAGCGTAGDEPEAPVSETQAPASSSPVAATTPDLAACAKRTPGEEDYRERKGPIPVPATLKQVMVSDMDNFAVSALDGGTVCVDASWMESISEAKISPDQRFVAFAWGGYEAFGYIVVDRSGKGQVIETGTAPLSPPGGKRFASVDLSESGYGGFNGFGVWRIDPVGLTPLVKVEEGFPAGDWQLESWSGDECVTLSVLPIDRQPDNLESYDEVRRDLWHAAAKDGWKPQPGACPKA